MSARSLKALPLILCLISAGLCVITWRFPSTSGDMRDLYPRSSETLEALRFAEKHFGSNLFDSIIIPAANIDEFDLELLEEGLQGIPGIDQMISPLHVDEMGRNKGFLVKNASGVRFLLRVENGLSDRKRLALHKKLNQFLNEYAKFHPVRNGSFFISQSLSNDIANETTKLIPLCAVLLFLLTCILFRSASSALKILLAPTCTIVSLSCFYALYKVPLGPVSQLAPPFIITIGTAYSIHLFLFASNHGRISREILKPIALAAATTSIGLYSLVLLDVKGVSEFAIMAGSGNILAALLSCISLAGSAPELHALPKSGFHFPTPTLLQKKIFVLILVFFSCIGIYGVQLLSVDTDPETFLISKGRAETSITLAKRIFPGSRFLSLILVKKDGTSFSEDEILSLTLYEEVLRTNSKIASLVSPISALKEQMKLEKFEIDSFSLKKSNPLATVTESVIGPDKKVVRFIIETGQDGEELLSFSKLLKKQLSALDGSKNYTISLSAFELVMATQAREITRGILWSLLCTLGIVALILLFFTRSLLVSLIGLIPNIVPILVVFGAIGLCFQHINLGAALVASAALGIAVDNTFHYILHWTSLPARREQENDPVLELLINPFAYTTIILSLGFSALLFARVVPTFQFGLLLIITLVIGLLADITLLPLLLSRLGASNSATDPSKTP